MSIEEKLRIHDQILANVIGLLGSLQDQLAVIVLPQMSNVEERQKYVDGVLQARLLREKITEMLSSLE
jgi:hypothetical protein